MSVQGLGYLGIETVNLENWGHFATGLLGLQRIDRSRSTLALRMDDRKQRIVLNEGSRDGVSFFGWEVAGAPALEAVAARLEAAGAPVALASRALAEERHVAELLVTADPMGNRLELFHGPAIASEAFVPGRSISGFRTGVNGMGHVVFTAPTGEAVEAMSRFYIDVVGLRLTDYYSSPFEARFLHANPRHHSLAIVQTGQAGFHHLMMELYSLDDVGQGYDLARLEEGRIATTLGRHTSDFMTSFYAWTPSRFMVEYGWGGRSIEPESWQPHERGEGPSLWGHERSWAPPEVEERARELRLRNAALGRRAPVQVMEGNYELQDGVCPWWDGLKASARK